MAQPTSAHQHHPRHAARVGASLLRAAAADRLLAALVIVGGLWVAIWFVIGAMP